MDGSKLVLASCRTALKSPFPPFLPLRPASACIPYPARIERWRRALRDSLSDTSLVQSASLALHLRLIPACRALNLTFGLRQVVRIVQDTFIVSPQELAQSWQDFRRFKSVTPISFAAQNPCQTSLTPKRAALKSLAKAYPSLRALAESASVDCSCPSSCRPRLWLPSILLAVRQPPSSASPLPWGGVLEHKSVPARAWLLRN